MEESGDGGLATVFEFEEFVHGLGRGAWDGDEEEEEDGRATGREDGSGGGARRGGQRSGGVDDAEDDASARARLAEDDVFEDGATVSDAIKFVKELFTTQVQKATSASAGMNVPVRGDTKARLAFYTLLPTHFQREVFLWFASSSANWPRLRSLLGAPPYAFLRPQDASVLNSTGIARGRANMAYEDAKIVNYSQFGMGQWVDQHDREYRVVSATASSESDALPSARLGEGTSNRVHLVCRVSKRSKAERIRRLKDAQLRSSIVFPRAGETLVMRKSRPLERLYGAARQPTNGRWRGRADGSGEGGDEESVIKVVDVRPRDLNSSTAAVVAVKQ